MGLLRAGSRGYRRGRDRIEPLRHPRGRHGILRGDREAADRPCAGGGRIHPPAGVGQNQPLLHGAHSVLPRIAGCRRKRTGVIQPLHAAGHQHRDRSSAVQRELLSARRHSPAVALDRHPAGPGEDRPRAERRRAWDRRRAAGDSGRRERGLSLFRPLRAARRKPGR